MNGYQPPTPVNMCPLHPAASNDSVCASSFNNDITRGAPESCLWQTMVFDIIDALPMCVLSLCMDSGVLLRLPPQTSSRCTASGSATSLAGVTTPRSAEGSGPSLSTKSVSVRALNRVWVVTAAKPQQRSLPSRQAGKQCRARG